MLKSLYRLLPYALLSLWLATASAFAQNYPTRPIRIIVPTTTGSTLDALARIVGGEIQRTWARQVVVENRPGENGNFGTRLAAIAPPDGHTLLMVGPGFAANPYIGQAAGYDPLRNFVPVSHIATLPSVVLLHPVFPAQNMRALVEVLKLSPDQFSYGSAGVGTSLHLGAEAFKHATQTQIQHVPFKNSTQADSAIVRGDVQLLIAPLPAAMPLVTAGRVRPIAISTAERHPALLDVPTFEQAGVANFDFNAWFGLVAPANTPPAVVQKLSNHVGRIMRQPKLRQRLAAQYVEVASGNSAQFTALIQKEQKRWIAVAEENKRAVNEAKETQSSPNAVEPISAPPPEKKAALPMPKPRAAAKPKPVEPTDPEAATLGESDAEESAEAENEAMPRGPAIEAAEPVPVPVAKPSVSEAKPSAAAPAKPASSTPAKPASVQPAKPAAAEVKPSVGAPGAATKSEAAANKPIAPSNENPREVLPGAKQ